MSSEQTAKIEVRVGPYDERGTFLGEVVRFSGEEIGRWTEHHGRGNSGGRGTNYTLYRCGQDAYRLHVLEWPGRDGEGSEARLLPIRHGRAAEGGESANTYTTLSENEARKRWGRVFSALGMAGTIDID